MAYNTQYQFEWNTDLEQPIIIYLKKKDSEATTPVVYAVDGCEFEYNAQGGKNATIYAASVRLSLNVDKDEVSPMPDFENIEQDTWLMEVWLNEVFNIFTGYVLPDECAEPFQDPPYSVSLTATDQMGLLTDTPLRNIDGSEFRGEHLIIEYLAAAFQQTGISLPIMVFDNVYHASHLDRNDDYKWDMMGQTKLEYRTFLTDATNFMSARQVIEAILKPYYFTYQWKGHWVVFRKELLQYWAFAKYYTVYDADGHNGVGHEIFEDYATVGKNEMIYPINETQDRTLNLAIREAKSSFLYTVWPEIPKNNKFDLGNLMSSGIAHTEDLMFPLQAPYSAGQTIGTFENYTIRDWEYGLNVSGGTGKMTLQAISQRNYRKIVKDSFLNILDDRIILETQGTDAYMQSEGVPIKAGDKINISFGVAMYDDFGAGNYIAARVYIIPNNDTNPYGLDTDGPWEAGNRGALTATYADEEDNREIKTVTVESERAPVSGDLYIAFVANNLGGQEIYIKDFSFTVTPFVAGSHRPVKGDFWLHGQNRNLPDVTDETVLLSDSDHKIFKGTLLNTDGEPLTPDWSRLGINEHKHYKQIGNLSLYNSGYRRFAKIAGDFTGITFKPINEQENIQPIALHKQYRMVDETGDRRYTLTAPLRIDLYTGNINAIFEEVYQADPAGVNKIEPVATLVSRIRAAIDAVTAAEWGSGGFDPYTGNVLPNGPKNTFSVAMPVGETMDVVTTGVTSVAKNEVEFLGFNVVTFAINKYAVGDTITFSAWDHEVVITVQQVLSDPVDGQETGDYNDFKYLFS